MKKRSGPRTKTWKTVAEILEHIECLFKRTLCFLSYEKSFKGKRNDFSKNC